MEIEIAAKVLAQAQAAEGAARTALVRAQAALFFAEDTFRDAVTREAFAQALGGKLGPAAEALAARGDLVFRTDRK